MVNLEEELRSISKSLTDLSQRLNGILSDSSVMNVLSKAEEQDFRPSTAIGIVFDMIKKNRKGISIRELKEKSGLEGKKLGNILYKLTKRGKVKTKARGIYIKAR